MRYYFVGHAAERQQDIWKWLIEVQVETVLGLRPGMTGGDIFDASDAPISRHLNNFPSEFIGHGIGSSSHEQLRMNQVNRTMLEPDTVVCLKTTKTGCGITTRTGSWSARTGWSSGPQPRARPDRADLSE